MLIKHLFVSSECYSEKPESLCSCVYRNCCSWSWGNRYVQNGLITLVWCLKICIFLLLLRKVFWHLSASFSFLYRRGTFAQGCERHNNQYPGDWGSCLYITWMFNYHPYKCLLNEDLHSVYCILIQVTAKLTALKGLDARLREIRSYLDLVIDGKLPLNHEILYHLQVRTYIFSFNVLILECMAITYLILSKSMWSFLFIIF